MPKNEKPLTLNQLVKYNKKVLFPFMTENFVTKKEFEGFMEIAAKKEDIEKLDKRLGTVEKSVHEIKTKLNEVGVL